MICLSKELIGNTELFNKLIVNFNNNNLSNSIIFTGPKGIGKTTLTFNLITKIFKSLSKDKNISNLIYNNSHPNIKYITTELDTKNIK